MIGRGGERGSEISVLAARHDDDDDIYIYNHIFMYMIYKQIISWLLYCKGVVSAHLLAYIEIVFLCNTNDPIYQAISNKNY